MSEFIVDVFAKGGTIVWIILALSVLGLAVFLERMTLLRREKVLPQNLLDSVRKLVVDQKLDEALQLCTLQKAAIARVITETLQNRKWNKLELRAHLEDVGRQETEKLSKHLGVLGTIASVCPLLGLLGTVYGMIQTFHVIEQVGVGQATQLAGGISVALYTTAAGLTVAIPALIAFRYCTSRVKHLATDMEEYAIQILERI